MRLILYVIRISGNHFMTQLMRNLSSFTVVNHLIFVNIYIIKTLLAPMYVNEPDECIYVRVSQNKIEGNVTIMLLLCVPHKLQINLTIRSAQQRNITLCLIKICVNCVLCINTSSHI